MVVFVFALCLSLLSPLSFQQSTCERLAWKVEWSMRVPADYLRCSSSRGDVEREVVERMWRCSSSRGDGEREVVERMGRCSSSRGDWEREVVERMERKRGWGERWDVERGGMWRERGEGWEERDGMWREEGCGERRGWGERGMWRVVVVHGGGVSAGSNEDDSSLYCIVARSCIVTLSCIL